MTIHYFVKELRSGFHRCQQLIWQVVPLQVILVMACSCSCQCLTCIRWLQLLFCTTPISKKIQIQITIWQQH